MELDELDQHIQLFDALLGPESSNRESRFDYQLGRDTRPDSLRPGREFHRIEITTRNHNFNPVKFSWFYHSVDDRSKYYLTSLSLRGLGLKDINLDILNHLNHLESIDFQGNQFSKLSLNQITIQEKVTSLNISSNLLENLVCEWSTVFPRLQNLNVHNNQMRSIDTISLAQCNDLNKITISNNKLSKINFANLGRLPYLRLLDCSHNNISNGKLDLSNPRLTSIFLNNNDIKEIEITGPLPSLKLLSLYENKLKEINLHQLYVHCSNLERLLLWGNDISKIRLEDGDRLQLKELRIGGNNLTSFQQLVYFPDLEILDLSYNQISGIDWKQIPQRLKELNLDYNPISFEGLKDNPNCSISARGFL